MDQEVLLEELRAEASCPLCLDILTDPVTLDCGHHCCASCLQECWQDLMDILPCPVCQHHCDPKKLQKNIQMSTLVDLLKKLPSTGSKKQQQQQQQEQPLCEQHQQVLSLFCEKDLQLVCAQCRVSCEQQGHSVCPTQEAAAQHRKKLKSHLQTLKGKLENVKKVLENQVKKKEELRKRKEWQSSLVCWEFENYQRFLRKTHHVYDCKLLKEMTHVSQKITGYRDQVAAYGSLLRSLQSDFTELSLQSDLGLLKRMSSLQHLMSMYKELEPPEAFTFITFQEEIPSLPSQYIGLQDISKFQVALTLDPETAHHSLKISEDRKKISFDYDVMGSDLTPTPKAFTSHSAVLSFEGFEAGRHFWVVEVKGVGVCSLGVCNESFPRQELMPQSSSHGCWKIPLSIMTQENLDSKKMTIGIFLDYELGELWLYDIDQWSPLYRLTDTFTEKLIPYFAVDPSSLLLFMTIR